MAQVGAAQTSSDFNLDGRSDVLLEKIVDPNAGLLRTLLINGGGLVGAGFPIRLPEGMHASGVGDFTGDGRAEILARKVTDPNRGLIRILRLTPSGTSIAGSSFPARVPASFSLIGIGDLDADNSDDLVYYKTDDPNTGLIRIYLLNANLTIKGTGFPLTIPTGFAAVGVADMNGDGRADVVLERESDPNIGLRRVLLTAPGGLSFSSSTFPGRTPAGYATLGVERFNDDPRADFLLEKQAEPNARLLRVQFTGPGATAIQGTAFPTTLPSGFGFVGARNYDGLGQADVMARKTTSPNEGLLRSFLLNDQANAVMGSGFPSKPPTAFVVIQTGPAEVEAPSEVMLADMFASRPRASGLPASAEGATANASKEAGEPNHVDNPGGKSVWMEWTATAGGFVQVDLLESDYDTLVAVYTGSSLASLTPVSSNDDAFSRYTQSFARFDAVAGQSYQIAVDGYNGASGAVRLAIEVALSGEELAQATVGAWSGGGQCGGNTFQFGYFLCPSGRLRGFETINGIDNVNCGTFDVAEGTARVNTVYESTEVTTNQTFDVDLGWEGLPNKLILIGGQCEANPRLERLVGDVSDDDCNTGLCTAGGSGPATCGTDSDCGTCWYCDAGQCRSGGEGCTGCFRGWEPPNYIPPFLRIPKPPGCL